MTKTTAQTTTTSGGDGDEKKIAMQKTKSYAHARCYFILNIRRPSRGMRFYWKRIFAGFIAQAIKCILRCGGVYYVTEAGRIDVETMCKIWQVIALMRLRFGRRWV